MRIFILSLVLLSAIVCRAQDLTATVNDLSFMSGTWSQQHAWGDMEEFWGEPMGNCMISSYRCVKNGKVVFYEFVVVEQGEKVPVFKLRHFSPGSKGWEDKDSPLEFPLVELGKNKAVFESKDKSIKLTYSVVPQRTMDIVLEEKNKEGKPEKMVFNYEYKVNAAR